MIVYNYDADLEVSDTCIRSSLLSWVELSLFQKYEILQCPINAYQKGTKIITEVNKRFLKNIGMHWNIWHHWFQQVPISFSLAFGNFKP